MDLICLVYVTGESTKHSKGIMQCHQTCRILIGLIHSPTPLLCAPKLIQYLLTQNKAFQSEKPIHVQNTEISLKVDSLVVNILVSEGRISLQFRSDSDHKNMVVVLPR